MSDIVHLLSIEHLTHDVLRIKAEKPENLNFIPGQAIKISINQSEKIIPFTITSLPEDDFLEFVVKTYPGTNKVINRMLEAKPGDTLSVFEPVGGIHYMDEGVFIAGGSGVAPFIAILKVLQKENKIGNNKLLFANKTEKDIILKGYFEDLLGDNFINILSEEKNEKYEHGFVNESVLKRYINGNPKYFYLCGPVPMIVNLIKDLHNLGINDKFIVKEKFF